jgi:hypothetical protein
MRFAATEELVLEAMRRTLVSEGFVLDAAEPHRLAARRGSEATLRILGGLMTSDRALPTAVIIDTSANGGDTLVEATVSDDFGVGFRVGLRERYATLAGEILGQLRREVETAGGGPDKLWTVTSAPTVSPPAPSTNTTADRLRRLQELHQKGLLTDDEYSEKRRAILEEL